MSISQPAEILRLDKLRFFIIDDDDQQRSSPWYVHCENGSVYAGVKGLGGSLKLSLHPVGAADDGADSQFGLTRKVIERARDAGIERLPRLTRWTRPPTPQSGAVLVATIHLPTDFLPRVVTPTKSKGAKIAIPMAPAGRAAVVNIYYHLEHPDSLEPKFTATGHTPIGYVPLETGEFVSLTTGHVDFDPNFIPPKSEWDRKSMRLPDSPSVGDPPIEADAILWTDPGPGQPIRIAQISGLTVQMSDRSAASDAQGTEESM
jgi:hypothetical protein